MLLVRAVKCVPKREQHDRKGTKGTHRGPQACWCEDTDALGVKQVAARAVKAHLEETNRLAVPRVQAIKKTKKTLLNAYRKEPSITNPVSMIKPTTECAKSKSIVRDKYKTL